MTAGKRQQSSVDEQIFDVGARFEQIAVGNDDVCRFTDFDGAELVADAENLRRVERYRF